MFPSQVQKLINSTLEELEAVAGFSEEKEKETGQYVAFGEKSQEWYSGRVSGLKVAENEIKSLQTKVDNLISAGFGLSDSDEEQILVVPTQLFGRVGYFQGFSSDFGKYNTTLLAPENVSYRPRSEMEIDPHFKQLIPYCIFVYTDDEGNKHIFQYTRGKSSGESRLHAKKSIGVGGHISRSDMDNGTDTYTYGMYRELYEEVHINTEVLHQIPVGVLNDDSNDVGRVHLGIVHVFDLRDPNVTSKEDKLQDSGFLPLSEILQDQENYETWSQLCLKEIFHE